MQRFSWQQKAYIGILLLGLLHLIFFPGRSKYMYKYQLSSFVPQFYSHKTQSHPEFQLIYCIFSPHCLSFQRRKIYRIYSLLLPITWKGSTIFPYYNVKVFKRYFEGQSWLNKATILVWLSEFHFAFCI